MDILIIHLWRIICLTIILASAYGAGALALTIARFDRVLVLKQSVHLLSVTLGLGILSYLTLIIGLLGLLYQQVLLGMLILFALAGIYMLRKNNTFVYFGRFKQIPNFFQQLDWFYKLLLAFLIIFVLCFQSNSAVITIFIQSRTQVFKIYLTLTRRYFQLAVTGWRIFSRRISQVNVP